jgi:hypothetical protein
VCAGRAPPWHAYYDETCSRLLLPRRGLLPAGFTPDVMFCFDTVPGEQVQMGTLEFHVVIEGTTIADLLLTDYPPDRTLGCPSPMMENSNNNNNFKTTTAPACYYYCSCSATISYEQGYISFFQFAVNTPPWKHPLHHRLWHWRQELLLPSRIRVTYRPVRPCEAVAQDHLTILPQ